MQRRWRRPRAMPSARNTLPAGTAARSRTCARTRVPLPDLDAVALADAERVGVDGRELDDLAGADELQRGREVDLLGAPTAGGRCRAAGCPRSAAGMPRGHVERDRLPRGRLERLALGPAHAAAADLLEREALVERHGGEQPLETCAPVRALARIVAELARDVGDHLPQRAHAGAGLSAGAARAADRRAAAAAGARPGARACLPSPGRPRRGRRRRRARGSCRSSATRRRSRSARCASARFHSARSGIGAQRVDVVQPDRCAGRRWRAPRRSRRRRGRGRPASRSPGRGRGRSRPRAGRGRSARRAARAARRRRSRRRFSRAARFSSARPAWPRQRALAVDDHDLLAGGAQRVGELAHRGGVACPPRWPRRRGCRRRRRARVERDQERLAAAGREAQRRDRARVERRRPRAGHDELGAVAAHALADPQVPDRRLVDRVAVDQQHGVGELEVGHASPAASGRPARAARRAAARRRCGALRWFEPRSSRSSDWRRNASSLVVVPPASAAARAPAFFSALAAAAIALSQLAGISSTPSRTIGSTIRSSECTAW